MLKAFGVFTCLFALFVLYGCGSGSGSASGTTAPTGSVALHVDLSKLSTARALALTQANPAAITEVKAILSGDNFGPATYDLTVSGNTATGTITNLPSGNMHIVLNAYSGTTLLYTGSSDVNVVSGAENRTQILLEPVNNGSVTIDVGLNPLPGYKVVGQNAGTAFYHDSAGGKTYVLDYFAAILKVWDAETATYLKDLALPYGMNVLAMSEDGSHSFVGCKDGRIYRLDTESGATEILADVSGRVRGLVTIEGKFLLAAVELAPNTNKTRFKVIDIATGNVTATTDYGYYIYDMVVNPANGVVYGQDVNVSPGNIHRIQVDRSTGAILHIGSSRYAGISGLSTPFRIIKNGTLLVSASGHTFTSSADPAQDLIASGSMPYYHDLASDDALNLLYLADYDHKKLTLLRPNDFGTVRAIDLPISPLALYQTNNSIVVFGHNFGDPNYYMKSFKKSDLGLIPQ